jgi:hypothetical protein
MELIKIAGNDVVVQNIAYVSLIQSPVNVRDQYIMSFDVHLVGGGVISVTAKCQELHDLADTEHKLRQIKNEILKKLKEA